VDRTAEFLRTNMKGSLKLFVRKVGCRRTSIHVREPAWVVAIPRKKHRNQTLGP
jgi:hypothetical protein